MPRALVEAQVKRAARNRRGGSVSKQFVFKFAKVCCKIVRFRGGYLPTMAAILIVIEVRSSYPPSGWDCCWASFGFRCCQNTNTKFILSCWKCAQLSIWGILRPAKTDKPFGCGENRPWILKIVMETTIFDYSGLRWWRFRIGDLVPFYGSRFNPWFSGEESLVTRGEFSRLSCIRRRFSADFCADCWWRTSCSNLSDGRFVIARRSIHPWLALGRGGRLDAEIYSGDCRGLIVKSAWSKEPSEQRPRSSSFESEAAGGFGSISAGSTRAKARLTAYLRGKAVAPARRIINLAR